MREGGGLKIMNTVYSDRKSRMKFDGTFKFKSLL